MLVELTQLDTTALCFKGAGRPCTNKGGRAKAAPEAAWLVRTARHGVQITEENVGAMTLLFSTDSGGGIRASQPPGQGMAVQLAATPVRASLHSESVFGTGGAATPGAAVQRRVNKFHAEGVRALYEPMRMGLLAMNNAEEAPTV